MVTRDGWWIAAFSGPCVVCLEPYAAGELLAQLVDGWAHLDCWSLTRAGG